MNPIELPGPPMHRQPGLLRRLLAEPAPVLDELAAEYGSNYRFGAGPVRMAVIGDPSTLRELLAMPTDNFRWGHKFNVLGFVVGDESMIVSDGTDHKRRRSSVQGAFSRRRLNGWIPMIIDRTDVAIDAVIASLDSGEGEANLYDVGRSLVLDVVVRALFGEELAKHSDRIGELFRRPQDYLEAPAVKQIPHPIPWTARAKVRADRRSIDAIIDDEIARLRATTSDDPNVDGGVLASLVREGTLTDNEIRDQVVSLMGAGFDTTSASLAWMFWCVSLLPGLWQRLRTEADEVFGPVHDSTTPYDHHTLAALDLADRAMRETTRLHPAGVISPREAASDLEVGGYRIPKGTLILWSAHLAGRNADSWSSPETFNPDRFVDLTADQKAAADAAWVPFGRGARNCIGFALAQMELTLIISRVAQRLDVTPTCPDKPVPVGMVVNRPTGGAPMRVRTRQ